MQRAQRFNSINSFDNFFRKETTDIILGKGSEGICFLGKNGLAYKRFYNDINNYNKIANYNYDKFITIHDCNTESYALPITLFCFKERVIGYTSKLVEKDLLLNNDIRNGFNYNIKGNQISYSKNAIYDIIINNFKQISFHKMKKDYEKLYNDTLILSDKGIKIRDIKNNILYDGTKFVVVDTGNYIKTKERVARHNITLLENSLKDELEYLYNLISKEYIDRKGKMYSYINTLGTKLNEEYILKNNNCKTLTLKKITKQK
ncbi:MAG: hypothetical protein IKF19_05760 [Bacilli bacterium]|nr:hypothetical protein [Bacilli bacterium]